MSYYFVYSYPTITLSNSKVEYEYPRFQLLTATYPRSSVEEKGKV